MNEFGWVENKNSDNDKFYSLLRTKNMKLKS